MREYKGVGKWGENSVTVSRVMCAVCVVEHGSTETFENHKELQAHTKALHPERDGLTAQAAKVTVRAIR